MKKLFIAPLLLSAMVCGVPSVHADTMDWMKGAAGDTLKFFGEAAEGFVSGMAREARSSHWCMDHEQAVINKLLEQGVAQDDVRISMAKGRYDACKAAADGFDQAGNKVASGFGDAFTFVMNQGQAEIEANRAKEMAMLKGVLDNEGAKERLQMWFAELKNPDTLKMVVGYGALTVLGIATSYYVAKFGYDYAKTRLHDVPHLIRETSVVSPWLSGKRYLQSLFVKNTEKAPSFDDVVVDPVVQDQVDFISASTAKIKAAGDYYNNVLLYGPPGTGKTAYAKLLAKLSGLDFAMMNGGDVSQLLNVDGNNKAITELYKIFDWARKSKKGVLLFIDEADAFLGPRHLASQALIAVLNTFLALTGEPSKDFMVVAATNRELDSAVKSRFAQKIEFGLPTLAMRELILQKKLARHCYNDTRTVVIDGKKTVLVLERDASIFGAHEALLLNEIAQATEGFSGRELEQIVLNARTRSYLQGGKKPCLTADIFRKAAHIAVAQKEKQQKQHHVALAVHGEHKPNVHAELLGEIVRNMLITQQKHVLPMSAAHTPAVAAA